MGYGGITYRDFLPLLSMTEFVQALQSGSSHLWLFIPSAILMGALHGLEPGHSKTMMAAFIIAIRGTVTQAVLLGLSAAVSHSLVIWILASGALYFGAQWDAEKTEPYLQIGSSVMIFALALWMYLRTRADVRAAAHHEHGHHEHGHHEHGHHEHGHHEHGHHEHGHHEHGHHEHEYQDAHEKAHAQDIERRFAGKSATIPQIVLFGITGGLMPCPAAFSILLICLQLKKSAIGFTMVAAFSFGLALTMVAAGTVAALGVRHAEKRFHGFSKFARRAPYFSCLLMLTLAVFLAWHGISTIASR